MGDKDQDRVTKDPTPNKNERPAADPPPRSTTRQGVGKKIVAGIKLLVALGIPTIAGIWINNCANEARHRREIRPDVLFVGQPRLRNPIVCDLGAGKIRSERMFWVVQNTGVSQAHDVVADVRFRPRFLVPHGFKELEVPPVITQETCDEFPEEEPRVGIPINANYHHVTMDPDFVEESFPSISPESPIEVYTVGCVRYRDQFGKRYQTCEVNKFYTHDDRTEIRCRDTPVNGYFAGTLGRCTSKD